MINWSIISLSHSGHFNPVTKLVSAVATIQYPGQHSACPAKHEEKQHQHQQHQQQITVAGSLLSLVALGCRNYTKPLGWGGRSSPPPGLPGLLLEAVELMKKEILIKEAMVTLTGLQSTAKLDVSSPLTRVFIHPDKLKRMAIASFYMKWLLKPQGLKMGEENSTKL